MPVNMWTVLPSSTSSMLDLNEHRSGKAPASLLVFADDWGRHPSSCQHLIKELLPRYRVLWVNTIGTRTPRVDIATIRRLGEKMKQWGRPCRGKGTAGSTVVCEDNLTVVNPRMWPWFTRRMDRRLNARLLASQLTPLIESLPQPVAAVTVLPITADLPGRLAVNHWLYYCVDDFAEWPGLDGDTLRTMDVQMIQKADKIVAVSEHLQNMIAHQGRKAGLLTHGVDLPFWNCQSTRHAGISELVDHDGPRVVFWGVIDRRLDTVMMAELSRCLPSGQIILVGPQQNPDERILQLPNVQAIGPRPFSMLPSIAQAADVLIMPYSDLPVTRAMQPLKMKEYIATGRPVVVSHLPAVDEWSRCMDVVDTAEEFASVVLERIGSGTPPQQQLARQGLVSESWAAKATQFERYLSAAALDIKS